MGLIKAKVVTNEGQGVTIQEREVLNADLPATSSRAYSGRAELRHASQVYKLVILLQLIVFVVVYCYGQASWTKHSNYLAERQYVVYEVAPDGNTTVKSSTMYQPREPLDQQIRHQGGMFIYWLVSVGSEDVERCLGEAKQILHPELVAKFDEISNLVILGFKDIQKIYRRVENLQVKNLTLEELPKGTSDERYHVLVTGKVLTYSVENKELLTTREFAYHVQLVPIQERTDWNPYALLIKDFEEVKMPAKPLANAVSSSNSSNNNDK